MWIIKAFNKHSRIIWLTILGFIILGPVFYYRVPFSDISPDILYVKAKVLQIMQGSLFADPITGYDTFHPPFYHLFLIPFKSIGLDFNTILVMVTIINVSLMFFLVYKIVRTVYDSRTGFYTCLLIPFILESMGGGGILLPSSFYFSVSFYLAGLWFYVKSTKSIKLTIAGSVFWGLAFLISPVYVFLLGLTFLYEALIMKRLRRFMIMAATFLVTITPFFVQAYYIYSQDLWGSSVFSFWREIPDAQWWLSLLTTFVYPSKGRLGDISSILFIIRTIKLNKYTLLIPLAVFVLFGVFRHYAVALPNFRLVKENHANLEKSGSNLWQNMDKYLKKNRYIFCTKSDYREYILGRFPAYSLGAWRNLDYYQLNPGIADMLRNDYYTALGSDNYEEIIAIADKYEIETALISGMSQNTPLFKTLMERWYKLYTGDYFCIVWRPD
jgi:hypothetical protein